MTTMRTWIIEPRDPLIARDGRPFGLTPGARARSLGFPFPSTTTGAFRTRLGQDERGVFTAEGEALAALRHVPVVGPLLVKLDDKTGEILDWLLPAPADALPMELETPRDGYLSRVPLVPLQMPAGAQTDLPAALAPVGPVRSDLRKPYAGAPRFWSYENTLKAWLIAAQPDDVKAGVKAHDLGLRGLEQDWRTHVAIKPDRQAADEGMLFQTNGLEFTTPARQRLALALIAPAEVRPGFGPVGGERRMAVWRVGNKPLPACPSEVVAAVVKTAACRIILATPAYFKEGYRPGPDWLANVVAGVKPTLVGAAVGRPAVVSGWDYTHREKGGRPKPTKRLAPAGSVYSLKLTDGAGRDASEQAVRAWLNAVWLRCVSENELDNLDGFGLAAVGAWSGEPARMEAQR